MLDHVDIRVTPALVFSLALAAGVCGQLAARHLRVPAIVPLLLLGVALGPDGLDWVRPEMLGSGLHIVVELGVAVILFEAGLQLEANRLRRQGRVIRRLISVGAIVTVLGAAVASHLALGFHWPLALLFGALVIVTGPTVIGPLLENVRVRRSIDTILRGEGVLIDPIGAIVAAIALPVALGLKGVSDAPLLGGALLVRIVFGALVGIGAGLGIAALLRPRGLIPNGLETLVALGAALLLFAGCEAILSQTGVFAVTMAGIVVGNSKMRVGHELRSFQEVLTLALVGLLFVLLAANVRLAEVASLGVPGLLVVIALVLVVRPANILLSSWGSELDWRERAFLSWVAPRGIVAAAVSSLFAHSLEHAGVEGAQQLKALVFLTIAVTVLVQGLSAGAIARALGVRRPDRDGIAILGAGEIGVALAESLAAAGRRVALLDSNPSNCRSAEERGLSVTFGNALEPRTLLRAQLDSVAVAIGLTGHDEVNVLFVREAHENFGVDDTYVAVGHGELGVGDTILERQASRILFNRRVDVDGWSARLRRGRARLEIWSFAPDGAATPEPPGGESGDGWLMLAVERAGALEPMHTGWTPKSGDCARVLIHLETEAAAREALALRGWKAEPPPAGAA